MVICVIAVAQKSPVYGTNAGAIKGYDPVAYFTQSKAVKGDQTFTYDWNGVEWRFSSAENRNLFKADPVAYAPQFGGYCAYGVSKGALYKTEPEAWKIVNGKLYLNYDKSVQRKWEGNRDFYIQEANTNWPKLIEE